MLLSRRGFPGAFEGPIGDVCDTKGAIACRREQFRDPFFDDYVISLNLIRRHLDTGQRAMIAAELAKLTKGRPLKNGQNCPLSNDAAAKQLNVSPRTVKTVKAVKEADPELAEQVKQGKVRLSTAARAIKDKKPVHDIVTDETTVQLPLAPEPVVAKLPTASPWDELEFGPTSTAPPSVGESLARMALRFGIKF